MSTPDPPTTRADGRPLVTPRWGLGDVAIGLFAGQLASALAYLLAASATDYRFTPDPGPGRAFGEVAGHLATGQAPVVSAAVPLWLTAVLQIPLWAFLLGVPLVATRLKGNGPVHDLGLRMRAVDAPIGLVVGVACQLILVPLVYIPIFWIFGDQDVSAVARQLTDRATDPFGVIMLFAIVGIGAPIAEEVFFRGLTQRSAARRFSATVAWVGTAAFFAVTHFELLQLPALFLFGLILGWMARRTGRLGPSIWTHLGFNMTAAIVLVWDLHLPLSP